MSRPVFNSNTIHLNIGDVYIGNKPAVVWTVLGSCVAIVFYNSRLHAGAICHAQLPEKKSGYASCRKTCPVKCSSRFSDNNRFKYVTCSFQYMLERFHKLGIHNTEIEVKLFGGSNVFATEGTMKTIGAQNIEVAMKLILGENGLKLVKQSTGGKTGRTIYFYTNTGQVYMKQHKRIKL